MDLKREKILIEGGLESACHKSGKIFIHGEFYMGDDLNNPLL